MMQIFRSFTRRHLLISRGRWQTGSTRQLGGQAASLGNHTTTNIDFSDHKTAFENQSFWDLSRAFVMLKLCSIRWFTSNSVKIFEGMQRRFGRSLTSLIVKPFFYQQFVGGSTVLTIKENSQKLSALGCDTIILIVAEAIEKAENATIFHKKAIEVMKSCTESSMEKEKYMQIRLTAFFRMTLLKELSMMSPEEREKFSHDAAAYMGDNYHIESLNWLIPKLPTEPIVEELQLGLRLLEEVGQKAVETNTVLMIDAEYVSVNPALTSLALALALRCNTSRPVVWNTTQCYLKNSLQNIQSEYSFAQRNGLHYGAKVVRGAYMVHENKVAKENNSPSPVHDSHQLTNQSYDRVAHWLINTIASNYGNQSVRFILASHNKESILKAIQKMKELNISKEERKVLFGQTYGMYDSVTYTLAKAGYPALKSMAVGTVNESLPYLARRAQENTSVMAGTREERQHLRHELLHRLK